MARERARPAREATAARQLLRFLEKRTHILKSDSLSLYADGGARQGDRTSLWKKPKL
jgi:hypothetical protein